MRDEQDVPAGLATESLGQLINDGLVEPTAIGGLSVGHAGPVIAHGGIAVLPARGDQQSAVRAGAAVVGLLDEVLSANLDRSWAVVIAEKNRTATIINALACWAQLAAGGHLIVAGHNQLGIRTTIKQLAKALGIAPDLLAQRAHSRVVGWRREGDAGGTIPSGLTEQSVVPVTTAGLQFSLHIPAGVFGAGGVDAGSALLLENLAASNEKSSPAPRQVIDLGCGSGLLGLAAASWWPETLLTFADHDARAVQATQLNAQRLGYHQRTNCYWWDSRAPWSSRASWSSLELGNGPELGNSPEHPNSGAVNNGSESAGHAQVDLVVCNPPFHTGRAVDFAPAYGMFTTIRDLLADDGVAWIVANRQLPYEAVLQDWAKVECRDQRNGFKILRVVHRRYMVS